MAEQVERLAEKYEIHLYSSRVQDVDLSKITWHRIPALPGPHIFGYCWWFLANHVARWWDKRFRGLKFDLTYTPGINCLDADVICVHILFFDFQRQVRNQLRLRRNPVQSWPRIIHQRLYYRLIIWLERIIYPRRRSRLTAVSRRTAENMAHFRRAAIPVMYHGVSTDLFNPERRLRLRDESRASLGLRSDDFCLLMVGNGWRGKGLETLLEVMGTLAQANLRLLVVGQDDPLPYRAAIARMGIENRVKFLPIRPDVECYYAASDIYVCPSLEDAFGVPPLEAMACGLPVVISTRAGVSELITDGVDGLILQDPKNVAALAQAISGLHADPAMRATLGRNAARTASNYTWDRNTAQLDALFQKVLAERTASTRVGARGRIAVVSPFLDRRHGTERRASELTLRMARDYGYEVHIYSQQVDLPGVERFKSFRLPPQDSPAELNAGKPSAGSARAGHIFWHKLPKFPGPHLFNYLWWFVTNHVWRWWDRWVRGGECDLVYTPGINCLNADVASVHIIFAEFYRLVRGDLALRANPVRSWPIIIHRRIYYRLIIALEKIIYARRPPRLAVISRKTFDDVMSRWDRDDAIPVVYGGLDPLRFSMPRRVDLRIEARREVGLADDQFCLLMIGNDWKKKGLDFLLEAMGKLRNPALRLVVAGQDSVEPYRDLIQRLGLAEQLIFVPIRSDVEFYYAAADAYVCPSLEDAFAYPPFEAMACGLPVIVSSQAGVSELITDEVDGLLLPDPRDAQAIAGLIERLILDPAMRGRLGENAAKTATQYTWERNAGQFYQLFQEVLRSKGFNPMAGAKEQLAG